MINGCRNLDDLPNRSCPPCYLQQGRVYTNQLNPDTSRDFAGVLGSDIIRLDPTTTAGLPNIDYLDVGVRA
jgi:hypothetical protein